MTRSGSCLCVLRALALIGAVTWSAGAEAQPQGTDYGDAPENVLAYPSTGGMGFFPTCLAGPSAYVRHGLGWARFGSWDSEGDGNAGICPQPPYDLDECWSDGDAGLVFPTAFTIVGASVVRCPNVTTPVPLGVACTMAQVRANYVNNMPVTGYINVLFDWDLSGRWGGGWQCPAASAPEHAVVNVPVAAGSSGLWTSPPFLVGSTGGVHVWMRLEIAERPVPPNWDGSDVFEDGESEDYLVEVTAPVPVEQGSWGQIKSVYR